MLILVFLLLNDIETNTESSPPLVKDDRWPYNVIKKFFRGNKNTNSKKNSQKIEYSPINIDDMFTGVVENKESGSLGCEYADLTMDEAITTNEQNAPDDGPPPEEPDDRIGQSQRLIFGIPQNVFSKVVVIAAAIIVTIFGLFVLCLVCRSVRGVANEQEDSDDPLIVDLDETALHE